MQLLHRLFAGAITVLFGICAHAAEVHVMISGGFSPAFAALAPAFEKATGHRVLSVRGASSGDSPQALPSRIRRGEPVDVLIMVGASLEDLERQGMVRPGTRVDLARSTIGMVVRSGAARPDISTADTLRRTVLESKSIALSESASGTYLLTTLFPRLGIGEQAAAKSRQVRGEPAGAAVARGEAELGFQQVSELIVVPGVTLVGEIPAELQQDTLFSAGVASAAKAPDAASALIAFLASPDAAASIAKTGLSPLAKR